MDARKPSLLIRRYNMPLPLVVRFFAPVNNQTVQRLVGVLDDAPEAGVTLLLATTGGSTDAGIAAYNFIKSISIPVTIVNMGVVASIGAVMFCAGDKRLSRPQARFTFHPNTFNIQNQTLGIDRLEEMASQLRVEHESIASIIAAATGKPHEEARKLIVNYRSLSAADAHNFGLVHVVEQVSIPTGAKVLSVDG